MSNLGPHIKLQRVLEKLDILMKEPADFVMTRWIFDWDESNSPIENIKDAHREMAALVKLKNAGCINLRVEENPTRFNAPEPESYKLYGGRSDYRLSSIKLVEPSSDKAWQWYDWAVWITDFDNEKFNFENEKLKSLRMPVGASVIFRNQTFTQGTKEYIVHGKELVALVRVLWPKRKTVSANGIIESPGSTITLSALAIESGLNESKVRNRVDSLNRSLSAKKISSKIRQAGGTVQLEVRNTA